MVAWLQRYAKVLICLHIKVIFSSMQKKTTLSQTLSLKYGERFVSNSLQCSNYKRQGFQTERSKELGKRLCFGRAGKVI